MRNTYGNSITLTVFGESHGRAVGAVIDGLCAGIEVSEAKIAEELSRRRPTGSTESARHEEDKFQILSGVFNGKTTGSPICIVIPNEDVRSEDYSYGIARPSHADYAAYMRFHGNEDYRGGGHFSGRITAAIVAAGAIFKTALENRSITIGTHILRCGNETDRAFENTAEDVLSLRNKSFPVLNPEAEGKMRLEIEKASAELDSMGGITQTAIVGICAGVGEPLFDSVEGAISRAVFAIGGIKGIEFGNAFEKCCARGSEYNDGLRIKNGSVVTETNNNGGINGGFTNGMPVVFNCAVKPTPSIGKEQNTVDFLNNEETVISVKGRHDPAIIRRICPVIDSVSALAVCDLLATAYGSEYFLRGRG